MPGFRVLAALALVLGAAEGCSSSSGPHGYAATDGGSGSSTGGGGADSSSMQDAPGVEDDASSDDSGEPSEASAEASSCTGLGAACTTSATCYCGPASGCGVDNVICSDAGKCEAAFLPALDAGNTCCSACQLAYDQGTSSLAAWLACNAACGAGECPVTCFAP
jgi:hypothetical protein